MQTTEKQKRVKQVNVSLSPQELEKIKLASEKTGRFLSNFGRIAMIELSDKILQENGNTTISASN